MKGVMQRSKLNNQIVKLILLKAMKERETVEILSFKAVVSEFVCLFVRYLVRNG